MIQEIHGSKLINKKEDKNMEEYALKNLMIQLINKQNDESSKSNGLINDDKKDDAN